MTNNKALLETTTSVDPDFLEIGNIGQQPVSQHVLKSLFARDKADKPHMLPAASKIPQKVAAKDSQKISSEIPQIAKTVIRSSFVPQVRP